MAWIIASVPFWILGVSSLVGAFGAIKWNESTTDDEAKTVFSGLIIAGIFFIIAAVVAR